MANYVLLKRIEVTSNVTSVTFSNIPQSGYTDLKVTLSARTNYGANAEGATITFNGSNTYSSRYMQGDGSTVASGTQSIANAALFNAASSTANVFSNSEFYIPNYLGTSKTKTFIGRGSTENNATQSFLGVFSAATSLTGAITSMTIAGNAGGSFEQYSIFSLYGIAQVGTTPVSYPKATGGNIIVNDGTYWYHAFTSTGVFTPSEGLSCDVLQVAGGGGVSNAGGGAGGYLTFTGQNFAANTPLTAIVGGGGAGNQYGSGTNGSNSQLGSLTASVGGGGGATAANGAGSNGGSGGGSAGNYATGNQGTGGTATAGQGNNGGAGWWNNGGYVAAGGGGAGAVGGSPANGSTVGGDGGAGLYTAISGGATTGLGQLSGGQYYFAGGGGGSKHSGGGVASSGGVGGGGAGGAFAQNGTSGSPNTGGGAGDAGYWTSTPVYSGTGGSGVIVVRYLMA